MPKMPRVQRVILPILRADPDLTGVKIGTWVEDIDYRLFPMLNIRRVGGFRHKTRPDLLALPVVEMTAYGTEGLPETEDLYETALEALYEAVRKQTLTEYGYLHSIKETFGATQFSSLFQDSWRIQGLIQLGLRSVRPDDLIPVLPEAAPDPVSFFEFNEGSGLTATDSINGHVLTSESTLSWGPDGGITWGPGFTGEVGPGGTYGSWSVAFELKVDSLPLGSTKSIAHNTDPGAIWFNINTMGQMGPWAPDAFAADSMVPGVTHTWVFVFTPSRTKLYLDGQLSRVFPYGYTTTWQGYPTYLMDWSAPEGSTMYSARFWDVALTADQVADL